MPLPEFKFVEWQLQLNGYETTFSQINSNFRPSHWQPSPRPAASFKVCLWVKLVGDGGLLSVGRQLPVADPSELSSLVDEVDDVGPDAGIHVGDGVGVRVAVRAINYVL